MKKKKNTEYPSCQRTYVTLNITSNKLNFEQMNNNLNYGPSYTTVRDDGVVVWQFTTKNLLDSTDNTKHIDYLFSFFNQKEEFFKQMFIDNFDISVSCYWKSAEGQGGPELTRTNIITLNSFYCRIWFDIY